MRFYANGLCKTPIGFFAAGKARKYPMRNLTALWTGWRIACLKRAWQADTG
ncbi:hypothetical protein GCM10027278_18990 [Paralcaligenes ginsengisoli]